jgi:signal transduction histidine kinase
MVARDITERKRYEARLKTSHEQFRKLASRIQSIREEERTLLAREIHDELGQALTVLKIQITLLANKLRKDQGELKDKVNSITDVIDQTVDSLQRILAKLRPGILDELGLVPAIEWQAQDFQKVTGIVCDCMLPEEPLQLDKEKSTVIFRIFQEALTNIARHANATHVSVILKIENNYLIFEVTDNGIGISKSQIIAANSLGLLGMKERTMLVGGQFQINGVRDQGTNVKVEIPLLVSDYGQEITPIEH